MEEHRFSIRMGVLLGLFFFAIALFLGNLYQLQIVDGADYAARAASKIARTETVEAARGQILDRYGRVLVSNRLSYQVRLDVSLMGDDASQNEILLTLLDICQKHEVEWNDSMPISVQAPYGYTLVSAGDTTRTRFSKLCTAMKWTDPVAEELLADISSGTDALREDATPSASALLEQMRTTLR